MTEKQLLKNFIGSVERIAFSMKAPNEHTPQFVSLCQEARTILLADDASGVIRQSLLRELRDYFAQDFAYGKSWGFTEEYKQGVIVPALNDAITKEQEKP